MLIVTTHGLPGFEIQEVLGEVLGVAQRKLGRGSGSSTEFEVPGTGPGGGATGGTGLLETRRAAIAELARHARRNGANAVVGLTFDTVDIAGRSIEVCAYGTAVVARRMLDHTGRSVDQSAPAAAPAPPPAMGQPVGPAVGAVTGTIGVPVPPASGGYRPSDPHRDVTMSGAATADELARDTSDHVQQIRRRDRPEAAGDDDTGPRSAGVRDVTLGGDPRGRHHG